MERYLLVKNDIPTKIYCMTPHYAAKYVIENTHQEC